MSGGDDDVVQGLIDNLHRTNEKMQLQEDHLQAIEDAQATTNTTLTSILARLDTFAGSSIPAPHLPRNNGVPRTTSSVNCYPGPAPQQC